MKKLVLSAAVAVVGLVGMNAQTVNSEALQLGVRAGLNISNINGDIPSGIEAKSLTGFHVGLFTEIPVAPRFSVQPEVIYSEQGAKAEGFLDANPEIRTQYINVPVLAKFYIADGFNLQAGPQIGFLTGADLKGEDGNKVDISDSIKSTDFGILLGAGYKMPMGLTIDARYNLGLSNIYDGATDEVGGLSSNDKLKNGVFQVGLGYQF